MTLRTLQVGMEWLAEQPGGLNRFFFELARHLPATGVEVRGLVAGAASGEQHGIRAFAPRDARLWHRWLALRRAVSRILAERDRDLVACHFALYAFPILDLVRHLPLVVHFQGPWATEGTVEGVHPLKVCGRRALERKVYRRARRCIALSGAFRDLLAAEYGVDRELIRVIPGGVDLERFAPARSRAAARDRLGWPQERRIVLATRRLARRMGLENLLAAVPELIRQVPGVLLLLAGEGPLAGELAARIRAAGLGEHARLLGLLPEECLPLAYRAADVSVVPTAALEGFGLSTVESLACGTPVVATPVGANPEVLGLLDPRLLAADASPAALAAALAGALNGGTPDEGRCRAHAARYAWPVVAACVRDVYMEALGSRPGKNPDFV